MKYVIMSKSNAEYFMLAVPANNNRKIKEHKASGWQIVGRMKNDKITPSRPLTICAGK